MRWLLVHVVALDTLTIRKSEGTAQPDGVQDDSRNRSRTGRTGLHRRRAGRLVRRGAARSPSASGGLANSRARGRAAGLVGDMLLCRQAFPPSGSQRAIAESRRRTRGEARCENRRRLSGRTQERPDARRVRLDGDRVCVSEGGFQGSGTPFGNTSHNEIRANPIAKRWMRVGAGGHRLLRSGLQVPANTLQTFEVQNVNMDCGGLDAALDFPVAQVSKPVVPATSKSARPAPRLIGTAPSLIGLIVVPQRWMPHRLADAPEIFSSEAKPDCMYQTSFAKKVKPKLRAPIRQISLAVREAFRRRTRYRPYGPRPGLGPGRRRTVARTRNRLLPRETPAHHQRP